MKFGIIGNTSDVNELAQAMSGRSTHSLVPLTGHEIGNIQTKMSVRQAGGGSQFPVNREVGTTSSIPLNPDDPTNDA